MHNDLREVLLQLMQNGRSEKIFSNRFSKKQSNFILFILDSHQGLLENIKVSFYILQANGYYKDVDYGLGCI
jgi:hypothetical protein